jgi:hypothetical protein
MYKIRILLILTFLFLIGQSGSTFAYSIAPIHIGTYSGNDNDFSFIESEIELWLGSDIILNFYAKVDEPALSSGGLILTYNAPPSTGTWATLLPINFYTIKAGNEFTLWQVGPYYPDTSGDWSTEYLTNGNGKWRDISHMTAFQTSTAPIPSTVYLLGFGLIGLIGSHRLFRKAK